ncbi:MAG: type I glyceraldehyde-3-phosphate dehydrogenase [Patescibacteria group bacterium]
MSTKNKQIRVAINGFGRIGRAVFKFLENDPKVRIVAINDLTDNTTLAHLFKYDSVFGKYTGEVNSDNKNIYVNGSKYPVFEIPDPSKLPWKKLDVDVVIEATGFFVKDGSAKAHIKAGAKKVVISAPAKGGNVPTYLIGVNEDKYKGEDVVSMASCTTNCIAPVTKLIDENFWIKKAFLTTIHAYTSTQNLIDGPHKDLRRARAAAHNMIPTTTGAAIAVAEVLPKLKGKFEGIAIRVPVINGSLSDLVFEVKTSVTIAKVNSVFKKAAKSKALKEVISAVDEPIVSTDIVGDSHSSVVDLSCTQVVQEKLIKVFAWYDNEYAYSKRLSEMVEVVCNKSS